ncbi:MAG TPA: class III poly(R)-hydroxyalkanoic acid synthase subunit PhaC [Ktedonobacteraceae bacterium]|nr:class III poly(R)-hydroxyalkanoic acid synthase subunit PhaC [Ktedonobacteraceae bacterium]
MRNEQVIPRVFNTAPIFEKDQTGRQMMLDVARVQTGQTPKEVIWTKNKARLYHYKPVCERRFPVPLLCIYALINRSYILDLLPGNSLIEYLVNQGFEVYLLDWGIPGEEDKNLSFDQYVLDYIARAVKRVLKHASADECSILGYCMGGTMSAMYTALFPDVAPKNLILLTTPIDFTPKNTGLYGIWMNEAHFNPDPLVDAFGTIPGEVIHAGNRLVKLVANSADRNVTRWDGFRQNKPRRTFLAMNQWVNDGVPFAGEAFRQWIRDFYQKNKLAQGEMDLRGRRVDLSTISCPLLTIAGKKDHICTPPQAEAMMSLVGSQDKEFCLLDAGHVGLLTSSEARQKLLPKISSWLETRSH